MHTHRAHRASRLIAVTLCSCSFVWRHRARIACLAAYRAWLQPLLELLYFREFFKTHDSFFCNSGGEVAAAPALL